MLFRKINNKLASVAGKPGGPLFHHGLIGRTLPDQHSQDAVTGLVNALAGKAALSSPSFSGNPTVPNQAAGSNNTRAANTAFVQTAVQTAIEQGGGVNYSAAEQWTGRTWLDGKKIYQKTVDCGTGPNNAVKSIAHGIVNMKPGGYFKVEGFAVYGGSTVTLEDRYSQLTGDATSLTINASGNYGAYSLYATLFYTCTDR